MGTRPFITVTWDGHGAARSFFLSGRARRRRVEAEGQRGCRHTKLPAHRQLSLCCLYYFLCLVFEKNKKKSSAAPAHLPFPRCSPGKRRRGWLRPCSSPWCPRGGRRPPRNGPNRGCHPPSPRAPIAPGHPRHSPWLCPTEVRGVRGVPRARTMPVPRIPRRRFAKGCGCRQRGVDVLLGRGVWGGLFPKPTPDWIRLLGKGCVCSPSPGTYRLCLSPPAGPAFAFGAGRRALRQSVGVLLQGERCGMGAGVALPARRAWLFLQKAALGPHQRPCLRPHQSSSSPKCPSPCPRRRWVRRCSSWTSQRLPPCRSGPRGAIAPAPQFPHPRGLPRNMRLPPAHQAPSAFPAELRPPKFCQEQADKPPWQDANGHLERDGSRDICAFCHKAVGPREPTVEAMRKQYHADCFTCRTCHQRLAGQRYYQRDGRPTCDACYQATLEKCAKCQGLISERIVRAMGKGFHPSCFACTACGQAIGAESFAVDERDEVYCVADFYRKYAPVCGACKLPIIPSEDQDTYKIECLGRSFHESCYRCESCGTPLSPEPTEDGCYPLGQHLLCKSCHVRRRNESSC
uniref:LIM zinc-binding domain-containing protein n=1 Tax=Anser cygnoides TaxID=8845 RepID=A0A8B9EUG9_ANSCY